MLTLEQFQYEYFADERKCVEVTDKEEALSFFQSRSSAAWGNSHVQWAGWSVIMQPSRCHKEDPLVAYVCKTELIGAGTKPYLYRQKPSKAAHQ